MNADERAEKIVYPLYLEVEPSICRDMASRIAAQIREAETEAYHRGVNHTGCINTRQEALEAAAKVAETLEGVEDSVVARHIRALGAKA